MRKEKKDVAIIMENRFIQSSFYMPVLERRLLNLGWVRLGELEHFKDLNNIMRLTVSISEWSRAYPHSKITFSMLENLCESLRERKFITYVDGVKTIVPWFGDASISSKDKIVSMEFSRTVQKFLAEGSSMTAYFISNMGELSSFFGQRLYDLCIKRHDTKNLLLKVEDARFMLDCQNKYPEMKYFNQRVISAAIRDINKNSHITITNEKNCKVKKGKEIVSYSFLWEYDSKLKKPTSKKSRGNIIEGKVIDKHNKTKSKKPKFKQKDNNKEGAFIERHSDTSWADGIK